MFRSARNFCRRPGKPVGNFPKLLLQQRQVLAPVQALAPARRLLTNSKPSSIKSNRKFAMSRAKCLAMISTFPHSCVARRKKRNKRGEKVQPTLFSTGKEEVL